MLFLAGDLTQWHLPVGMKDLDLWGTEVTGKAKLIKAGCGRGLEPRGFHSGAAFLGNNYSDFTSRRNHAYPRLPRTSRKPVEQLPVAGCEIGIVVYKKCRSRMVPLI